MPWDYSSSHTLEYILELVNISLVCSIVFSIGIGLPGPSISNAGEGFLLYFVGGLWALLGVVIPLLHSTSKPKSTTVSIPLHHPGFTYRERLTPLLSNLSVRSQPFRFSIVFSIIGAIGLLIAVDLGLTKASWVLITICVLFLRSEISTTFSFIPCVLLVRFLRASNWLCNNDIRAQPVVTIIVSVPVRQRVFCREKHQLRPDNALLNPVHPRTPEYFKSRADVTCPSTTIGYANRCRTSLMRSITPLDWLSLEETRLAEYISSKLSLYCIDHIPIFFSYFLALDQRLNQ